MRIHWPKWLTKSKVYAIDTVLVIIMCLPAFQCEPPTSTTFEWSPPEYYAVNPDICEASNTPIEDEVLNSIYYIFRYKIIDEEEWITLDPIQRTSLSVDLVGGYEYQVEVGSTLLTGLQPCFSEPFIFMAPKN